MSKKRKALVTGCCGFIGSNLVHQLVEDGWSVEGVDDMSNGHQEFLNPLEVRSVPADFLHVYESQEHPKPQVLVVQGDFAHDHILGKIRDKQYDVIFHFAANPRVEYSVNNPTVTTEQNILKTVGLFEVASKSDTRVVFSSSASVYGDADEFPTREDSQKVQNSPYGLQKFVGEQFGELFSRLYGLDIVSLRYFNVYGPRQFGDSAYSTAVCAWCDKVSKGQPLRSDGDGTQSRDLVYVGDVVAANILAANHTDKWVGEAFNIASGEIHTNNEILDIFREKFPGIEVNTAPTRPGDVMRTEASITKSSDTLGYTPKVLFSTGLEMTWKWWESLKENSE